MLYQKAAGKAVQIRVGLHCRPSLSRHQPHPMKTPTPLGDPRNPPRHRATPPPHRSRQPGASWGPRRDPGPFRAMDGRKPLVPNSGLAMQVGTERSIFHASKLGEGLVQELDGPSLDAFVLGPKEGSNGHEGREVRNEVPGHSWHFMHFHPRFR